MKTSELTGPALDWAMEFIKGGCKAEPCANYWLEKWIDPKRRYLCESASTNWAQGGPIIEREGICLSCVDTMAAWDARIYDGESEPWQGEGETPLIAAMRCVCASKLGDEIEVPEELSGVSDPEQEGDDGTENHDTADRNPNRDGILK